MLGVAKFYEAPNYRFPVLLRLAAFAGSRAPHSRRTQRHSAKDSCRHVVPKIKSHEQPKRFVLFAGRYCYFLQQIR